jgi:hypothetical protein
MRNASVFESLLLLVEAPDANLKERACLATHSLVLDNFQNQTALRQEGGLMQLTTCLNDASFL